MTAAPHIAPDIAVFYDGHCPVCRFEVRLYERLDTAGHIQWTDIETLHGTALPAGKTREDLLGKFHVRDLQSDDARWHIGVDAFARIWRALPGFRHFALLFRLPIIRQLMMIAYRIFLKWQSWHRRRRVN